MCGILGGISSFTGSLRAAALCAILGGTSSFTGSLRAAALCAILGVIIVLNWIIACCCAKAGGARPAFVVAAMWKGHRGRGTVRGKGWKKGGKRGEGKGSGGGGGTGSGKGKAMKPVVFVKAKNDQEDDTEAPETTKPEKRYKDGIRVAKRQGDDLSEYSDATTEHELTPIDDRITWDWHATRSLGAAEAASGDASLAEARKLLDTPGATAAASALKLTMAAAKRCDKGALAALKSAERAMRDVVVVRCCSDRYLWPELRGRASFLAAAEAAFGEPLDQQLRDVLLLAYYRAVDAGIVEVPSDARGQKAPHSPDGSPPGAYRELPAFSKAGGCLSPLQAGLPLAPPAPPGADEQEKKIRELERQLARSTKETEHLKDRVEVDAMTLSRYFPSDSAAASSTKGYPGSEAASDAATDGSSAYL